MLILKPSHHPVFDSIFDNIFFILSVPKLDGRKTWKRGYNICPRNVSFDPCSQILVGTMTLSLTRSSPRRVHSWTCLERSHSWFRVHWMGIMSASLHMDR